MQFLIRIVACFRIVLYLCNMKQMHLFKRIAVVGLMLLIAIVCRAVKANPQPFTVVQPDGKPLTVVLYGDEYEHYSATTDGVLLFHKGNDYFVASVDAEGMLSATSVLAHNAGQRSQEELTAIGQQQRECFHKHLQARARRRTESITTSVSNYFPHTGSPRAVVILAEFSDEKFKHDSLTTHEIFDLYLNSTEKPRHDAEVSLGYNTGSVAQYFAEVSYGLFTPSFDVYGPVCVPGTMASYGKSESVSQLMKDALAALDPEIDLTQYDENGDGEIDLVYIIYAGYGENYSGNSENCIWPKAGTMGNVSHQGKSVVRYGVHCEMGGVKGSSDRINGIGLFCHEFSHTLGLPDLYTNATPSDDLGMEDWDLMDGGEYLGLNIGTAPCEYSAWEREVMGWREMETLTENGEYELRKLSEEQGRAFRIEFEGRPHEYIYLENIQRIGWNRNARGHGMLAVHVRYNSDVVSSGDHPNNSASSTKRVTVVPADGHLYSSYTVKTDITREPDRQEEIQNEYLESYRCDPFPGNLNITEITDETDIHFVTFDGEQLLGKPITNIQERGGVIRFTFLPNPIPTSVADFNSEENTALAEAVFDLQGRRVARRADEWKKAAPHKGIYIIGNKKHFIQ